MPGHQCYHCKQWVEEGEAHDCWTTTEAALTRDLSEDLQEAYERLRGKVKVMREPNYVAATGRTTVNLRDPDGWRMQLVDADRKAPEK